MFLTEMSNSNRPFYSKRLLSKNKYFRALSIYIPFRKIKNQAGIMFEKVTGKRVYIRFFK